MHYSTLPAFIEKGISMPNMKCNNIPWGDPVLAPGTLPGTSLSRQQESKQAQRLHPVPPRVFRQEEFTMPRRMIPETAATPSNPGYKYVLCRTYARTRNCPYGTSCKLYVFDNISVPPFSTAALASIILPFLSPRINEQKAVDPCGFATTTYMAYVTGNPAYLYTPKIPNLVCNHLNFERMVQQRLKPTLFI
jgi:hypothetical protein